MFDIKRDKTAQKNTNTEFNIIGRDQDAKGHSLVFRTAGGSTNGIHPSVVIVDDPCDKEDRTSEATRKAKRFWFDSLSPLLVPFNHEGKVIKKTMILGTKWHFNDLFDTAMQKGIYDCEVEGIYNDKGEPSYPEFFPEERIQEIKKDISSVFFASQYLNKPQAEEDLVFDIKKLHFFDPKLLNVSHETISNSGTNYCFFDPALGKKQGDYPAVIWVTLLNGKKYIIDALTKKFPLATTMDLIVARSIELKVKRLVYETNGTTLLDNVFNNKFKELKYNIMVDPIHEVRNKIERLTSAQPDLYNGSVLFREDHDTHYKELMNQILFFPVWKHDDFLDCLEKAISYINGKLAGAFIKPKSGSLSGGKSGQKSFSGSLRQKSNW